MGSSLRTSHAPGFPWPVSTNENPLGGLPGSSLSKSMVIVCATIVAIPLATTRVVAISPIDFAILTSHLYSTRQGDTLGQLRNVACAHSTFLSAWQPVHGFATLNVSVIDGVMKANV